MSRLKRKDGKTKVERLTGKADIFHSRLGTYQYVTVFKRSEKVHGKHSAIFYTGKTINGRLYGVLNGANIDNIRGNKISLMDAPEELIEDALRWV